VVKIVFGFQSSEETQADDGPPAEDEPLKTEN
jgi:hypothetical protein